MNEEEQRQEALDELFSPDAPTEREKARLEKKRKKAPAWRFLSFFGGCSTVE